MNSVQNQIQNPVQNINPNIQNGQNQASSIEYRLFYASGTNESEAIYNTIVQNGLYRLFEFIDVTTMTMENLQRLRMNTVPTIVISSPNVQTQIHDGPKACSMFLNAMIMNRRCAQIQETELRMKSIQQAQRTDRMRTEGPSEFSEAEMSGVSDAYAYLQTDLAQAKSYVLYGQEDATAVITPQYKEIKINERQMSGDLATMEKIRAQDMNTFKSEMEQRQIDSIFYKNG